MNHQPRRLLPRRFGDGVPFVLLWVVICLLAPQTVLAQSGQLDFGDAPAPYPTTLAEDGARHIIVAGMYLGAGVSGEADGQPDPTASADTFDDGVKFLTALARDSPCTVRVIASAKGFLDGWIDFNANGSWEDPGEQIFVSVALSPGTNFLTFNVPAATPGTAPTTFARFRFSSSGNLRPTGLASDGEVEDYAVQLFSAAADLCVSATINPDPIPSTSDAQCLLSVTNAGPSPALNVVLTDTLFNAAFLTVQPGATGCTIQGNQLTCQIGNLAPGEARTIMFSFHPRQFSLVTNILSAASDVFDPRPANNRVVTIARAAPPLIITMPPQDLKVRLGDNAKFTVAAQGYGALSYQWFSDGTAIAGATDSTLILFNVQSPAMIQVQVADSLGSILSAPAALGVIKPPAVVMQPVALQPVPTNSPAQFAVQADGTVPLQYQWRLNGANIPGATNQNYVIPKVQRFDGGTYTVAIANDGGVTVSDPVLITFTNFPRFSGSDNLGQASLLPQSPAGDPFQGNIIQSDNFGATTESGEPPHAGQPGGASIWYLWRAPATGIATFETLGSTFDTLLAAYAFRVPTAGPAYSNLVELASDDDHAGYFRSKLQFNAMQDQLYAIAVDGFAGRQGLFVLGWKIDQTTQLVPTILAHPQSRTVPGGATLTLDVNAISPLPPPPNGPALIYQWQFNGELIQGANSSNLVVSAVRKSQVGTYSAFVGIGPASSARFIESHPAVVEIGPDPNAQSHDKIEGIRFTNTAANVQSSKQAKSFGGGLPFVSVAFGIPGSQIMNNTNSTADIDCFRIGTATRWLGFEVTTNPIAAGSTLRVDTSGSAINTELGVYRFVYPSCLQLLSCMHTNFIGCDTNSGMSNSYSILEFTPTLGGDYIVFADGLLGTEGVIEINWSLGAPPFLDPPSGCTMIVPAGTNVTLNSGVTNHPSPPPSYQWYCFGVPLPNATNSSLAFAPIQSTNAGAYSVIISNSFGVATNNCCVVVTPPQIRYQPSLTNLPNQLNMSVAMPPGMIQSATNLSSPAIWQNLVTNLTTNCNCQLSAPMQDTNGVPLPSRFYRVRSP